MPQEFDITTFVALVRTMRDTQKKYYKTRDYNLLLESKRIETDVDRMIKMFDESQVYKADLFKQEDLPF